MAENREFSTPSPTQQENVSLPPVGAKRGSVMFALGKPTQGGRPQRRASSLWAQASNAVKATNALQTNASFNSKMRVMKAAKARYGLVFRT